MTVLSAEAEPLGSRRLAQAIWGLLILGLLARIVRYLLHFPLWDDEAFLAANFLDHGYLDLLEGLDYHQVCPLLFLWVQLTLVNLLGFSEYTLRLFPLLCGVGSLFLFRHFAGRLLKGTALLVAVGVVAVSYSLIRHSVEAKPYGCDVFVSLVMLTLFIEWERGHDGRWLWCLTAFLPIAIGLSNPAVFMGGGISLALAFSLFSGGPQRGWGAWIVYNLVLLGSFAGFFFLCTAAQSEAELGTMRSYWEGSFPPMTEPLKLAGWLLETHTGGLMPYPVGSGNGGSTLTFICCVVALVVFLRRGRLTFVVLCLTPAVLNFIAAALHRYPYGASPRFGLYLAPIICWLMGLGGAVLLAPHAAIRSRGRTSLIIVVGLLATIACGSMFRDFVHPYKAREVLRERDFARWFWFNKAHDAELVCLWTDLKQSYSVKNGGVLCSALYRCNQRIYSPRLYNRQPPDLSRVSADWPLRCVRPESLDPDRDELALDRWLRDMKARYQLVSHERHPFPSYYKDRELISVKHVDVYEFVPRPTGEQSEVARVSLPGG